jgi:2-keto-3-deoxy-L-rhamnonate aldolase RhmA
MFIKPNKAKAKLKAGQSAFGVIATSDDPQLAELFGISGFDYYMLDAEHGLIDPIQALNVIRTCEITNITPMIRIGSKTCPAISGRRYDGDHDAGFGHCGGGENAC